MPNGKKMDIEREAWMKRKMKFAPFNWLGENSKSKVVGKHECFCLGGPTIGLLLRTTITKCN